MDHRYPQDDNNEYEIPRTHKNRSYQDAQGEYWIPGGGQQYEDPQLAGSTVIDPRLQYEDSSPTILPPGTSIASYGGYRQAGYQGYGSSSSSHQPAAQYYESQQRQPTGGEAGYEHSAYEYQEQDIASTFPLIHPHGTDESDPQSSGDRARPEKKYLCPVEACDRSHEGCGFTTLNDLERHGRSKHGDDGQYVECRHERCPDKGKRFPRRDNFVDHFWRVHGNGSTKEAMKAYALEKAKEWMVVKQAGNWSNR
ncbi:hypothetical protein TWF225_004427 [Orbilia oligospora]|nr:hypothetical protein TWF225_004427 [Orbilia oligospora]KAF3267550.1 hypothetical protein TWF128_009086 [Orbilia oligospora]KAF3269232.1 hypothetical protein TWF217_009324 [Orbilia oligospora]KAF3285001.1 hypothetical protein TWF132_009664 [Orbilia oligospora]